MEVSNGLPCEGKADHERGEHEEGRESKVGSDGQYKFMGWDQGATGGNKETRARCEQ